MMTEIGLRDYISEVDSLIEGNSYDEAIAHCRHILQQYPKYLEAYRVLGKAALEKEDYNAATDIFQRVLSVDPEDFVARVGLSIVYDRQDKLNDALWHMERGFELMPSNDVIQGELRRLYGRRDGVAPDRIGLTRGALARMYAQGDLCAEAISELRTLLRESPDRIDLQVLLAETLWRDEQVNEAASVAERVLDKLPNCLTANLLLGEIWLNSGFSEDGEMYLRRAQAVDPDNLRAVDLLGASSPLSEQRTTVKRLAYESSTRVVVEPTADQVPDWLAGLASMGIEAPESSAYPGLPEPQSGPAIELGPSEPVELPDWLTGGQQEAAVPEPVSSADEELPDWMSDVLGQEATVATISEDQAAPTAAEDGLLPDWLTQTESVGELPSAAKAAAVTPELPPDLISLQDAEGLSRVDLPGTDWLSQLGVPAQPTLAPTEDATPEWLSRIDEPEAEMPAVDGAVPGWLSDLGTSAAESAVIQESAADIEKAELPDWLAALRPQQPETAPPPVELPKVEESEVPDWMVEIPAAPAPDQAFEFLQRLGDSAVVEPVASAPEPQVTASPASPVSEAMPSADEALAFLQSLTAGKEDELRAQAEREADERIQSIVGGKPAPPVAVAPSQQAAPPSSPAVPEGMPSAYEALAFLQSLTVGKEDELRAQAEREGESRMEAIMGGKPGTSPLRPPTRPLEPPPPVEAVPPAPEGMPSADEALAFLQSLAAGKEDELRAQAEREGEARMEAIMGGKPGTSPLRPPTGPLEPPRPVETALPGPEALPSPDDALAVMQDLAMGKEDETRTLAEREADAQTQSIVIGEPVPLVSEIKPTELPPSVETPVLVPEGMPSADEALAFLTGLAAGKEDELRAQAEREGESRMEAIMGGKPGTSPLRPPTRPLESPQELEEPVVSEAEEVESTEEALAFLQELTAEQAAPPRAEALVTAPEPQPVQRAMSFAAPELEPVVNVAVEYWLQTALDEGEDVMSEDYFDRLAQPTPPVTKVETPAKRAAKAPARPVEPEPERISTPALAPIGAEEYQSRLDKNADDHEARLGLARVWWASGDRVQPLRLYQQLIDSDTFLVEVVADLQRDLEAFEHSDWYRALGDAHMKLGNLARALDAYREALTHL